MKKSNSIIWFEWFSKEKEEIFEKETKHIWDLSLRNGIAPTICKKWLREELCKDIKDEVIDKNEIKSIEVQWVQQKKISIEKFTKHRPEILDKCRMSENNLKIYCMNELKAIRWAEGRWSNTIEQVYLETKDRYDEVKLQMLTIPIVEKGLTLEVYQQLKEQECDFAEVGKLSSLIKYQSKPLGTWYHKTSLRKEIYQTLTRLTHGDLSSPFKVNNSYTIIKFCGARGTELTDEIRRRIIIEQMASFIDYGVEQLLDHISK